MEEKEQLFEQMNSLWNTFVEEHNKTTKVSNGKSRKAIGELKKLITPYRSASNAADKK